MCGIVGIWNHNGRPVERVVLDQLTDSLAHRGPDGRGTLIEEEVCLGLGHRRLSILDLTEAGHQPMPYADKRYWIVFNGEIYNYRELGSHLESGGLSLRSTGDTEVLVEAIARWGLEHALDRIRGMFAMAVLDRQENTLTLVRDRMGICLLYTSPSPRDATLSRMPSCG